MTHGIQRSRLVVAALVAIAWVFASNHCVFAAIAASRAAGEHACCASADSKTVHCSEQCCAKLTAPVPHGIVYDSPAVTVDAALPDIARCFDAVSAQAVLHGPAPPGRPETFFADCVVGSSQFPLAPPVFVD